MVSDPLEIRIGYKDLRVYTNSLKMGLQQGRRIKILARGKNTSMAIMLAEIATREYHARIIENSIGSSQSDGKNIATVEIILESDNSGG